MKKPHNKTNLFLGLIALGIALWYSLAKEIGLLTVGGFAAAWAAAEYFLNLAAEHKSTKGDKDDLREQIAVDTANRMMSMGSNFRGGSPAMLPTSNIQLDDHKRLLPVTWGILLILYWWMPLLAFDVAGASGPVQLFSEPLLLLVPVVLAGIDFWMLKKR